MPTKRHDSIIVSPLQKFSEQFDHVGVAPLVGKGDPTHQSFVQVHVSLLNSTIDQS
jgi:hypothetical protein